MAQTGGMTRTVSGDGTAASAIYLVVWELAMDIDDELVIVSLVLAEEEEENRKKKRRFWVHNINRKRLEFGSVSYLVS